MVHRAMPTLLRELAAPFASDPDYEALQIAPAATINLVNGGGGLIGLFVVADNGGAPVAGSYNLQPIEVCETSLGSVVVGGVTEVDVPTGRMLVINASGGCRFGVRLVGPSLGAATRARVFWRRID